MAKDITYYFKQCLKFDVLKLPPNISKSTIMVVVNEMKEVICFNGAGKVKACHCHLHIAISHVYSSCSQINACQILQCNFDNEIFADKLITKTAKFTYTVYVSC